MAAKDKLDLMSIQIAVNIGSITTMDFLFQGQAETYAEFGLTEADSGVDNSASTALKDSVIPICTVSQLLKRGGAVRLKASGTKTNGKTVSRSLIVAKDKVDEAIAKINGMTVDGAVMKARTPTRRRLQ
jgi:hypothetical protein